MKTIYDILVEPFITEKSNKLHDKLGKVVFKVNIDSTKHEIKRAIELLFKVKVLAVNTILMQGKKRRVRHSIGRRPNWKKAIITLEEGQTIEFFEGI